MNVFRFGFLSQGIVSCAYKSVAAAFEMVSTYLPGLLVAVAVFTIQSFLVKGLQFTVKDNHGVGFSVYVGNTELLRHSKASPVLFVGNGYTQFKEHSGNFDIRDYVSERIGLSDYDIKCDDTSCLIGLLRGDSNVTLKMTSTNDQPLAIDVDDSSGNFDRMWLRITAEVDEEVYGGGEQFSYFNLRHRDGSNENVFPIWTSEQGVGRNKSNQVTFFADVTDSAGGDYYTTYFPQPTFVSSRKFFFHHTGGNYAVLDFRHDSFHEICIHGTPGRLYLTVGSSLIDVVTSLTSLLGRMPELPDWIQGGAILGMQGGTSMMMSRYRLAKDNNIPVAALWIQDWSGTFNTPFGQRVNWNWRWDPTHYPDLDVAIKNLTADGVRVMVYINPNLNIDGDIFKEGAAKGYFVKNKTGDVYLMNSLTLVFGKVDLTNKDAYDWYKELIKKNLIGLGLGGWMADFGEYLPADAVMANGQTGQEAHNDYPRLWSQLNREALEETGNLGKIVFFTRAGFSGSSNYTTLMWAGDQNVDFSRADGVKSTVTGALSLAMSGTGITHFDIGGYTTFHAQGMIRSQELLLRSAELAVFGPVFRTHEGNQPPYNVQWYTASAIKEFSRLARTFTLLQRYRNFVVKEAASTGLPVQRPLILHYDTKAPDTQFMFGADLLVCPVYQQNVTSIPVVLPKTTGYKWIHVWTGVEFDSGRTEAMKTPIGQPPVFYRSDSKFKDVFQRLKTVDLKGDGSGWDNIIG